MKGLEAAAVSAPVGTEPSSRPGPGHEAKAEASAAAASSSSAGAIAEAGVKSEVADSAAGSLAEPPTASTGRKRAPRGDGSGLLKRGRRP